MGGDDAGVDDRDGDARIEVDGLSRERREGAWTWGRKVDTASEAAGQKGSTSPQVEKKNTWTRENSASQAADLQFNGQLTRFGVKRFNYATSDLNRAHVTHSQQFPSSFFFHSGGY